MFTILLNTEFFSDLGINIIAGLLASILLAIPPFIVGFVKFHSKNQFYNALFSAIRPSKREQFYIKHYIKHTFEQEYPSLPEEQVADYKLLAKTVRNEGVRTVIILGNAGIGKSTLMCRLALLCRSKPAKNGNNKKSLLDYSVLFYKFGRGSSVDEVLGDIKQKCPAEAKYSLFLDGLDEVSELQTQKGSEVLNKLLFELGKSEYTQIIDKIFISLRPEILENGYAAAFNLQQENIAEGTVIYKLCNFNEKQIFSMYRNEKYSFNRAARKKITFKIRRQNLNKLKQVVKNNPQSVFTYPLILTWANEILCDHSIEELKYISWFDALGKVIDKELEREFELQLSASGRVIGDASDKRLQFYEDCREFLCDMALEMALSDKQRLYRSGVLSNAVARRLNESQGETTGNTILTHRLLKYVDWSERETGEPYYEFIHNTIYWRVLAGALLDPETPQDKRAEIILKHMGSTPLLQYCRQGLWSVYGDKAFPYRDYLEFKRAVDSKAVNIRGGIIPLEIALSCFYGLDEITVGYSIVFNSTKIKKFVENRELDFSNMPISDLSVLSEFGNNSFDALNCSHSDVVNANIPDHVTNISFACCKLLKSVKIPDSVTSIDNGAFRGCKSLVNVGFGNNSKLTSIYWETFRDCASLESITIPESVTSIDKWAFIGCTSLKSISVDGSNKSYSSQDGILFNKDKTAIILAPPGIKGSITIPDSVTSIYRDAFIYCTNLTSVTIPGNVTSIVEGTFKGCTNLIQTQDGVQYVDKWVVGCDDSVASLTLRENTKGIAICAFQNCKRLESITIPNSVTSISHYAFKGCKNLERITIPDGVTSIGVGAFEGCATLKSVVIPDSVTEIGSNTGTIVGGTFSGCVSLESVTLPKHLTSINQCTFSHCTAIKHIEIPKSVAFIGARPFDGCSSLESIEVDGDNQYFKSCDGILYNTALTRLIRVPPTKKDLTIPDSVTSIDNGAFNNCASLKSITIPDNVTFIGCLTFLGCSSLESITIPQSAAPSVVHSMSEFEHYKVLKQIIFNGTVSEWQALIDPEDVPWMQQAPWLPVIKCRDGVIKHGTVQPEQ